MSMTIQELRARAVAHSLFKPTSLKAAVMRLGFVQADPIRSPARAQDLILRHRVKGYKAGDLERGFPSLDMEEDVLYAYGFVHRRIWELLHPRKSARLSKLEKNVLDAVLQAGPTHPATLQEAHGRKRVINAWGDGLEYVSPSQQNRFDSQEPIVRFLAPFDPLVWDRRRFEHLWGWAYRFEAYTPPTKRVRGYYAMPLLWRDDIIGWANANVRDGKLNMDVGFAKEQPRDAAFRHAIEEECKRLRAFLVIETKSIVN
jgi:uncharacterized protein YcaQ